VKSAANVQTWAQRCPSAISFDIRPTRYWDPATNQVEASSRRQADLYVFALLAHREKETLDPTDLSQWRFFVLPTDVLNTRVPLQRRISLSSLMNLEPQGCTFEEFASVVERLPKKAKFD
jgi:hypothetical protein